MGRRDGQLVEDQRARGGRGRHLVGGLGCEDPDGAVQHAEVPPRDANAAVKSVAPRLLPVYRGCDVQEVGFNGERRVVECGQQPIHPGLVVPDVRAPRDIVPGVERRDVGCRRAQRKERGARDSHRVHRVVHEDPVLRHQVLPPYGKAVVDALHILRIQVREELPKVALKERRGDLGVQGIHVRVLGLEIVTAIGSRKGLAAGVEEASARQGSARSG